MDKNNRTCSVQDCENPVRARGWCSGHYGRWRKYGSPTAQIKGRKLPPKCHEEGCSDKPHSRWKGGKAYCNKHILRLLVSGTTTLQSKKPQPPIPACSVDGCDRIRRSGAADYCEMHYYRLRRNAQLYALVERTYADHCAYCGAASHGRKFCSTRCRSRSERGAPSKRQCEVCDGHYEPSPTHGRDRLVCSDECDRLRAQAGHDARRPISGMRESGRKLRYQVFSRDSWVCQLCRKPTKRTAKWPHPRYPTIDHIVPVAMGGSHTPENLQCACALCNSTKNKKILGQLNLWPVDPLLAA